MVYFLYGLFFLSCFVLIASVLLQPGKTDAGALFTSNISSTAFQPRGATTILSKLTIIGAAVFMVSALLLAMPALTGNVSVLQTTSADPTETAPAVAPDANSNANVDVNANANVEGNTNAVTNANANANAASNTATNTAPANGSTNGNVTQTAPANK